MSLAVGSRLGPYEILAPLGSGGMGEVYRARDARLARDVAVKVLGAGLLEDEERLRRFEQEARATGALNHPNILQVYDVGTQEGAPYVVSELLEGETLRDRIGSTPLPVRRAIDYASQIAKGLSAAHEKGIVHRDLKPENLFLTRDGRVKILDFGLAKLIEHTSGDERASEEQTAVRGTDAGRVLGTVGYMSPEQVRGQKIDHRSDIFSFGAVLYEMLAGKRAFRGPSAVETLNAILKEDPPPLTETARNLPPALERIVDHCLEKSPEARFQSAHDIAFDLEQLSGASSTTAVATLQGRSARVRAGLPVLVGVAVLSAALGALLGRGSQPAPPSFERVTFRREGIPEARFAPDGRTIVYESRGGGLAAELRTAQPGSPEARRVDVQDARLLAVSSRGELALRWRRAPGAPFTFARMPLSGGAPREVAEDVIDADWSPDGSELAVIRVTGTVTRLEFPLGQKLSEGVNLGPLRVSPQGDRVAFADKPVAGDNRGDIAVVDRAGKKTVLSSGWADIGTLAWSTDGREVLFSAVKTGPQHSIYAVDLKGRERLAYRLPGSVDVHDVDRTGRVLLRVSSGQPRILGKVPGETTERDLSWLDYGIPWDISADGKTLLFDEQGLGGGPEYSAYLRGTDGSAPARLGNGSARALSPDAKWALVLDLKPPMHAMLLPTGAGDTRELPRGPLSQIHQGWFTSDGKRVVLAANAEGRPGRLWIQDVAAGDPQPLTAEGRAGIPSGDASQAAIGVREGWELETLGGGGAKPVRIAGVLPTDDVLRFTADGRALIVRADGRQPVTLFKVDLATGKRTPFLEVGPSASMTGSVTSIVVTPDGRGYAYGHGDTTATLYVTDALR